MIVLWIQRILASPLGRKVLGGSVATIVSIGLFAGWTFYQQGKGKEEGVQECVQEINQETIDTLLREIAWQDEQLEKLREQNAAIAMMIRNQTERRLFAERQLEEMERSIAEQREEDEEYREWADSDLPDGVADRLRQAARSQADSDD